MKAKINMVWRAIILFSKLPKPILLSGGLASLAKAVVPFINIYMSALIINELIGYRRSEEIIFLVALTLGLNLFAALLSQGLERWSEYCTSHMWHETWNICAHKMHSMDFADVEDPNVQSKYEAIRSAQNGMGFGLHAVIGAYRPLIDNFMRLIFSSVLAFSLFAMPVPENSPLVWLDSWWAMLGVIAILLVSVFISPLIMSMGMMVFAKLSDFNSQGNRVYSFYYWTVASCNKRAKDIRIYNQKPIIDRETDDHKLLRRVWFEACHKADLFNAAGNILSQAANGAIYLYVAAKALAGAFPVGNIVLYVGAIFQFGQSMSQLIAQLGRVNANTPYLKNTLDFLDIPNKKYQGTLPVEKRTDNRYIIEFKNVSFKYPGTDTYALKNLSLHFELGKKLAIVGENGSGKTTMIKLLTRLYDPTDGVITLNGIDIKKYNYDEYMAIFGVVLQDFALMPFTLGQNIATKAEYDKSRAQECLNQAGLDMPLDTPIYKNFTEEGVEPSGGEEQKIALARALYKNAPFIVLDEPTAALDPIAEYEIYTRFNGMIGEKTAVYISHRLSSCRFCDDIIVFHEGNAIQRGSHDKLVGDTQGKYHELWHAQAQYYSV